MRTFRVVAAVIALTTIGVMPAMAQEPGKVGLTMTSESSVGLTIQATDRVAIRPEVGFTRAKFGIDGSPGERTITTWSPGVSLLFHLKSWDSTRLYLAPRWQYTRTTGSDSGISDETTASGHALSAMVGAQHNITNRFAVFGEVGIGRSSSNSDSGFSPISSHFWSTRSAVGAILFF